MLTIDSTCTNVIRWFSLIEVSSASVCVFRYAMLRREQIGFSLLLLLSFKSFYLLKPFFCLMICVPCRTSRSSLESFCPGKDHYITLSVDGELLGGTFHMSDLAARLMLNLLPYIILFCIISRKDISGIKLLGSRNNSII